MIKPNHFLSEKPIKSKSNCLVGLYKFTPTVFECFRKISKSSKWIWDSWYSKIVFKKNRLSLLKVNNATDYWLDTGSIESIISATNFKDNSQILRLLIYNLENLF